MSLKDRDTAPTSTLLEGKADIVFLDGSVITVNDSFDIKEAIAVKGKRIMRVGTDDEIRGLIGENTKVIDLRGRSVLPGFEDSHIHFLALAAVENQIDLSDAKDIGAIVEAIRKKAENAPDGSWLLGRGWDQEKMAWNREYRWPSKEELDMASENRPVFLLRICGHIATVNSKALKIAGIDGNTQDPEGGRIDHDGNGEPTGILREKAIDLVRAHIPLEALRPSQTDIERMIDQALANGITCIEEAGTDRNGIETYIRLVEENRLKLRVNLLLNEEMTDEFSAAGMISPYPIRNERLRVCGMKCYADGSLGGRTAALREPYDDDRSNRGILKAFGELYEIYKKAHSAGLQCCTHAIGDGAIERALEANARSYDDLGLETGTFRDRIEHCQIMDEGLMDEMRSQKVIASIQFSFAYSDSSWAESRIGERIRTSYAWRTLAEKGVRCCGGTDAPIESFVPLIGIERIITRADNPAQALTLEQAVRLYTSDSAYAQWQEDRLGSLETGKVADMIVLSDDIMRSEPYRISGIMVDMTLVDGAIVYSRG
jgi:hypothetical protein